MTAPYLSAGGVISYNGYTFNGPRNSVQLEVTPVRDTTDRYITHSVYRFSIDAWLTYNEDGQQNASNNGIDAVAHMTTLRGKLQDDGGQLVITGFGFGDVSVNTSDSNRDAEWGPKTRLLKMRSIGNGCIILMWIVEVAIKTCIAGDLIGTVGRIKEFVYSIQWSIYPNGCTVRRVQGHLDIYNARDRTAIGGLSQTADDYRNFVTIPPLVGFTRPEPQVYELDEKKQRLKFSVTDMERESDNAYPAGISRIQMDHSISTDLMRGGGWAAQTGTFSGRVEVAKPFPVADGWTRVLQIMSERLLIGRANNLTVMVQSVTITEHIYERAVSFNVRYTITGGDMNRLITGSGLFKQLTSTNDAAYQQSMLVPQGQRGNARLQHDPNSERFPTPCQDNGSPIEILDRIAPYFLSGSPGTAFLVCPPADNSYEYWNCVVDFMVDNKTVAICTMPTRSQSQSQSSSEQAISEVPVSVGNPQIPIQQRYQTQGDSHPLLTLVMRGTAKRIGFPPEIPKIIGVAGANPGFRQKGGSTSTRIAYYYNGCPVYEWSWIYSYGAQFPSVSALNAALQGGLESIILDTGSSSGQAAKKYKKPNMKLDP